MTKRKCAESTLYSALGVTVWMGKSRTDCHGYVVAIGRKWNHIYLRYHLQTAAVL